MAAAIINTDIEASKTGYEAVKDKDPFPEIPPALLNSADIKDYASKAFIISPFSFDDELFKPASYSMGFNGHYLFWDYVDGKAVRNEKKLNDGESFTLKSNSIAYIQLEPYIQLPSYIAARFNLQIKHVYRGLLLGTGPLVDPGWCGRLNIPIHNLTGEDYEIKKGEPMIWMEFTKITPNPLWHDKKIKNNREGKFVAFKRASQNRELKDYVHLAEPNTPIQSSLPKALAEYNRTLADSLKNNERTESLLKWFSISIALSIAGIIGAVGGFFFNVYNVGKNSNDYIMKSEQMINSEHEKSIELKQTIINFNQVIDSLNKIQKIQQKDIEDLKKKVR